MTTAGIIRLGVFGVFAALLLVCGGMWGCPRYTVYVKNLEGEALLRRAESERQVQIEDAKGKEQAAKMLASAEIERARAVAEANKIIGDSLKNNPEYLTWLWIEQVNANGNAVIYIPTEAGLPILEAGCWARSHPRRSDPPGKGRKGGARPFRSRVAPSGRWDGSVHLVPGRGRLPALTERCPENARPGTVAATRRDFRNPGATVKARTPKQCGGMRFSEAVGGLFGPPCVPGQPRSTRGGTTRCHRQGHQPRASGLTTQLRAQPSTPGGVTVPATCRGSSVGERRPQRTRVRATRSRPEDGCSSHPRGTGVSNATATPLTS